MILRDSPHAKGASLDLVSKLTDEGIGRDEGGYRAEFRSLVSRAASLVGQRTVQGGTRPTDH